MLNIDASIHRILSFAQQQGWSAEKYAAAAELPPSTVRDLLKGRANPTASTLRALERVIPSRFKVRN